MKCIFLAVLIVIVSHTCSQAQCVIYNCGVTGAWGTGYNETGEPTEMKECEEAALKGCKLNGGSNCKFMYKSTKSGWWSFMAGRTTKGPFYFAVSEGNTTKMAAEADVKKKYAAKGGPNPELTAVKSWYVTPVKPSK